MKPRQRVSKSGLELIKRFEGCRRSAARLGDGRWTVGYGHVKFAREGVDLTEKDAEALLLYDLIETSGAVSDNVFTPLSQNQFDALVSFAFNVGVDKFKTSSVVRRINEGDFAKAAWAIEVWRRSAFEGEAIVVDALVRRRAAEKALFLTPDAGFVPAPSPVLPPEADFDIEGRPPVGVPATLVSPLEGAIAEAYRASDSALVPAAPPHTVVADSITERLRALIPDEAPAEPEPAPEPDPQPTIEVEAQSARMADLPPAQDPEPPPAEEVIAPFPSAETSDTVAEPLPDAAPEPPSVVAQPAAPLEAPDKAPSAVPAKAEGIRHFKRESARSKNPLPLIGFSIGGALLFSFAIFWGLYSGVGEGGRASDHAVSYIAGILGVICIYMAASLLLDRFAGDDD